MRKTNHNNVVENMRWANFFFHFNKLRSTTGNFFFPPISLKVSQSVSQRLAHTSRVKNE